MTYKDAWTSLAPWNSMAADLAPENFADDRKAGKTTFVVTHEEIAEKYLTLLDYAQDDYMGLSLSLIHICSRKRSISFFVPEPFSLRIIGSFRKS